MKKFIYTFILLAGFQLAHAQEVQMQHQLDVSTPKILKEMQIQKQGDLSIYTESFNKRQKATTTRLAPFGIQNRICSGTTYYSIIDSITPTNDTLRLNLTSTDFSPLLGVMFDYVELNEITGTIDTIDALLHAEGSLVGKCYIEVFEENATTNSYEAIARDSINLASIGVVPGRHSFVFSNQITLSKDLLIYFYVISNDPNDEVTIWTTEQGSGCTSNSLYILNTSLQPVPLTSVNGLGNFHVEPHVYLVGNFSWETSSIYENASMDQVNIYPNPVLDQLKINNLVEATDINVYSITGQLVKTVSAAIGSVDIDVNNLSSGIYIVKMQSGKNTRTEKIQVVR